MRRFVLGWKMLGYEKRLRAQIVNYADDFVICCRGTAERPDGGDAGDDGEAEADGERGQDAAAVALPDESFDFLGYTIGRCYSPKTGRAYIGTRPSRKAVQRVCREISEMTGRRWLLLDVEDRVGRLNRILIGWANYFCLGPVSKAYRAVDRTRPPAAPSVVVCRSTRCRGGGLHATPTSTCTRSWVWSSSGADAQLPVGERVSPCPKAGCGKSARPV